VAGTFNIQRSTLNLLKKRHAQIKAKAGLTAARKVLSYLFLCAFAPLRLNLFRASGAWAVEAWAEFMKNLHKVNTP